MNNLLDDILQYDQNLLITLHQLGNSSWDSFWIFITNPLHWIPLFAVFFYIGYKKFKLKKALFMALWASLAVVSLLGLMHVIKNTFKRLRPIHDPAINTVVRKIVATNGFSFISGHSMVSAAIATLIYLIFRNHYKYIALIFLFLLLFAYSRIYLAVHYPLVVFFGILVGIGVGNLFYIPIKKVLRS